MSEEEKIAKVELSSLYGKQLSKDKKHRFYYADYVDKNFIHKDKIRAKIKEIDEDELLENIDFGKIALAIKVLYELLEE